MTDITPADRPVRTATDAVRASIARRKRKQSILKGLGMAAIGFAFLMLAILVGSLLASGYKAFTQTHLTYEVFLDPEEIDPERPDRGDYDDAAEASLANLLGLDGAERADRKSVV